MLQSHVIEVQGTFIGAAVRAPGGFRFRAVHPQVDDLDGWLYGTLAELRQATSRLFTTGRHDELTQTPVPTGHRNEPAAWRPRSGAA